MSLVPTPGSAHQRPAFEHHVADRREALAAVRRIAAWPCHARMCARRHVRMCACALLQPPPRPPPATPPEATAQRRRAQFGESRCMRASERVRECAQERLRGCECACADAHRLAKPAPHMPEALDGGAAACEPTCLGGISGPPFLLPWPHGLLLSYLTVAVE